MNLNHNGFEYELTQQRVKARMEEADQERIVNTVYPTWEALILSAFQKGKQVVQALLSKKPAQPERVLPKRVSVRRPIR